jgi:hypothetical protein
MKSKMAAVISISLSFEFMSSPPISSFVGRATGRILRTAFFLLSARDNIFPPPPESTPELIEARAVSARSGAGGSTGLQAREKPAFELWL